MKNEGLSKKSRLIIVFFLSSAIVYGQPKPQKTHDHEKFAKKVYGNFSAGLDPQIFLPDDEALKYISQKTGRSIEELKKERENNKIYLDQDKKSLSGENAGGGMVLKIELLKKEHPTLSMADIVLQVSGTGGTKRIELANCVQTDITWVLGDYMGLEGKRPVREKISTIEDRINELLADTVKNYSVFIGQEWEVQELVVKNNEHPDGKLFAGAQITRNNQYWFALALWADGTAKGYMNRGEKDYKSIGDHYLLDKKEASIRFMEGENQAGKLFVHSLDSKKMVLYADLDQGKHFFVAYPHKEQEENIKENEVVPAVARKRYSAVYSSTGNDPARAFMKPELFGKPVRGYYITKDRKKVDAVIKYQEPENMHSATSALLLYNIAYNEPGFTEDETNNFKQALMKQEISAFYVAGYLFVQDGSSNNMSWAILLKEGKIRESVWLGALKKEGKTIGYSVNQYIHQRDGRSIDTKTMGLMFKNQMSKFVEDHTEMAAKITAKEEGYKFLQYQKIVEEYNGWYEQNNPGKLAYFYEE